MKREGSGLFLVLAMIAVNLAAVAGEQAPAVRAGADLRLRQEYFDHIPTKAGSYSRGGENNYFRIRPRVWGEVDLMAGVVFRARAVNEFRHWENPDMSAKPQSANWEYPDEWVFDHLYLEAKDLLGGALDLRIGRQDLIYGAGKVILEGTPGDGSRTIYFNAAKAVWKVNPVTTVDLVGIYNEAEDEWAINPADRDLNVNPPGAKEGPTESGGILYLKNKSLEKMPFELYGIFKRENPWAKTATTNAAGAYNKPAFAWQTLDETAGLTRSPELDLWTVGLRAMPALTEGVKGNLELALQLGERAEEEVLAWMADAFLVWDVPAAKDMKPALEAGVYYLSGDDPSTARDEGWNPLWARYPQFSELYVYAFDADLAGGRWSNLMMPRLQLSLAPAKRIKATAMAGYMMALEKDGPGGGEERGWLGVLKTEFTLGEKLLLPKDKLTGHLWVEVVEPGNYYKVDDTALFARWELAYAF